MSRFVAQDDFDNQSISTKDEHFINEQNSSGLSLNTSGTLNVSSENEWLRAAAEKKGLKLSPSNTKMTHHRHHTALADHFYNSNLPRSNTTNTINTDFECLKTSAMEKGLELMRKKPSNTLRLTSTLHNSTLCDNDIFNELKKMAPDNNESKKDTKHVSNLSDENSAKNQIVFSKKKLLLENELLRKENVLKEIEQRKEEMENFSKNLIYQKAIMRTILAQKRQEEQQEKRKRLKIEEDMMDEKIKQNEIRRKREQQMQKQRIQEAMEKLENEQAEFAKQVELLEKIKSCPSAFEAKYENINSLFVSCKDRHTAILALSPYYQKLKDLGLQMDMIREKTQSGKVTNEDVELADDILKGLDEVIQMYKAETDLINRDFNAELNRREEEYRQAELQLQSTPQPNVQVQLQPTPDRVDSSGQVPAQTVVPTEQQSVPEYPVQTTQETTLQVSDDVKTFVQADLWVLYVQCREFLQQFQKSHNEILYNGSLKKFRFACQKAVITPVNAINAISREHLTDKYNRVVSFLTGKSNPKVDMHPQGFSFCIYMLAKKIVSQGETLVSSKPEMAFSLASFAVAIWNEFPNFGEMLLVHFRTTCPYTVPVWLPQLEENTSADAKDTKDYRNLKKHSGTLRLYASLMVSRPRQGVTKSHPHGIGNAWKWLAATLNIEPRVDTAELISTLVLDMLEVTGSSLQSAYPRQFGKLLYALRGSYFPKLKSLVNEAGGPVTRLEEFLEKCVSTNVVPPPAGLLPPNYW